MKLFQRIIKASSNEGDLILDCFMGSGTTAFASKSLNRNFIGFEISKEYCDIINNRLSQSILTKILERKDEVTLGNSSQK